MKPDLYTKSILSVIAASLIWLCVQNAGQPHVVSAQSPQRVIVDGLGPNFRVMPVMIKNSLGLDPPPLPVTIKHTDSLGLEIPIPVKIATDDAGAKAQEQIVWQYQTSGCGVGSLRQMGADGWEVVQLVIDYTALAFPFTFNRGSGEGRVVIPTNAKDESVCNAIMKRPLRK